MPTNSIELPVLKKTLSDTDANNQDHSGKKAKLCHYRHTKKTENNKRRGFKSEVHHQLR